MRHTAQSERERLAPTASPSSESRSRAMYLRAVFARSHGPVNSGAASAGVSTLVPRPEPAQLESPVMKQTAKTAQTALTWLSICLNCWCLGARMEYLLDEHILDQHPITAFPGLSSLHQGRCDGSPQPGISLNGRRVSDQLNSAAGEPRSTIQRHLVGY